jgi:DNA-directed RNA polymerase specialized sigma24 family protein
MRLGKAKSTYPVERKLRAYRELALEEKLLQPMLERMQHASAVAPELASRYEDVKRKLVDICGERDAVLDILRRLPDAERRLLTAYYVEGLTWEQASEYYPCSPRWVYANKDRILKDLDRIVRKEV